MKSTAITGNTIRFRRWSRKAYAAFASIGRCVTIGCLRKSVADSSLSKQKKTGTAGHAGCGEESTWKGITHSRQTDIGIPSGSEAALVNGIMEPGTNLQVLFREPVTCAYANTGKQETYISETKNIQARIAGIMQLTRCAAWTPAIRASFLSTHFITKGYDCKRTESNCIARWLP